MNVHRWTPITRDWVRIEDVTVDGEPVLIADLTVALVPVRSGVDGDTAWLPVSPHPDDGVPALLVAGADAELGGAAVLTRDAELHGRVSKNGTVVTAKLARFVYR